MTRDRSRGGGAVDSTSTAPTEPPTEPGEPGEHQGDVDEDSAGLVASVLTYIEAARSEDDLILGTPARVDELHPGDPVPTDADPGHVERLVASGVLVTRDQLAESDTSIEQD